MMLGTKIAASFVKAQQAFGPALKTHTNPAFKSKYADLSACIEAVIDALHANGIAIIQQCHESETGVIVQTAFVHESGETLECGKLHVPAAKHDPQGYGSALTYARRYSLMAACGIAPEDDDGNKGAEAARNAKKTGMAADVLAQWIGYIKESATAGDMKKRVAEAIKEAMTLNDSAAIDHINATADVMATAARAKASGRATAA